MTDQPPKKKSLAGLGQMMEKAAARDKAAAETAGKTPAEGGAARNYEITYRKKPSA